MSRKRRKTAFSLPELLSAIMASVVIMTACVGLLYVFAIHYAETRETTMAAQEGSMALSAIDGAISQASIGIPSDAASFSDAFAIAGVVPPFYAAWNGPVSVTATGCLRVVASRPLLAGVAARTDIVVGETTPVPTSGDITALSAGDWITFGTAANPARVQAVAASGVSILSSSSFSANAFERLLEIYGLEIYADPARGLVVRANGADERVVASGVRSAVFAYDADRSLLEVHLTVTGERNRQFDFSRTWNVRN